MKRLSTSDPGFEPVFAALLDDARETTARVDAAVAAIIGEVRARGDDALMDLTARFDGWSPAGAAALRVTAAEIDAADARIDAERRAALNLAAERIEAFHRAQLPRDLEMTDAAGLTLGMRWGALDAVGIYVPGGKAAYPSSVLMNAIPARAAGVPRIAMCVPTPGGEVNPLVLAAAKRAGVTEVYRIGGAQAVAAMAWGTASIAPVDRICGPGNAYVAEAKRQVFGRVGIDSIAGPSEVVVIADAANDPRHVAVDLLAQAEHDESAQSILVTPDAALADAVARAVEDELRHLPRAEIAGESWRRSICNSWWMTRARCSRASATPAPPSSAASAPRRWATTSPGRTTSCPPGARRASPRACRSSISSSAPPGSRPMPRRWRPWALPRWRWARPRA